MNNPIHTSKLPILAIGGLWIMLCLLPSASLIAQPPPLVQSRNVENRNLGQQDIGAVTYPSAAIRIKDITTIEGHRANRVTGIGLVTGLKGTGGKSQLTRDIGRTMLRNFDILAGQVPTGSISVVAVSAEIPPFSRPGEKITATVSVFDDAISLFGGELQSTTLNGFDGKTYCVAAGALTLSGFSAGGDAGGVAKNHDTTGKVPAQIEVGVDQGPAFPGAGFRLLLTNKDYATAQRIAAQINQHFPNCAQAVDAGTVAVAFPPRYQRSKFDMVVRVNELRIVPDIPARVVINQKTGTIIVGHNVKLSRIMFANENLVITTSETPVASQPAPFSQGRTVVLPRTDVTATETGGRYNVLEQQTTVGDLAAVLNTLGVSPRDLIGIFQSIRASGALQAQLIIE